MFRKLIDQPGTKSINCLIADGGMGDLLCSLVAVDYIYRKYPWINLLIWVPDYLLEFSKNVLPPKAIVRDYSNAKKKYDNTKIGITTQWTGRHTPMRIHPVDYSFHMLVDEHVDFPEKNYLKFNGDKVDIIKFNLPGNYVVIGVGSVFKVKEMSLKTIEGISEYCIQRGYTPVFIGKSKDIVGAGPNGGVKKANVADINCPLAINLVDKTSLLELAKIIQNAKAYIGMDGGNIHLAGFTDTPIVVGYTFIDGKKHNVPIRHDQLGWNCYVVEPDETLGCRFCQTKMNFVYGHEYPTCYYKDFKCLDHMTADAFITQLKKIL